MRNDKTARRSSVFENLFAERQVYLRSGLTSRYVVLSRSLQIAVTVGAALLVAGLALASYSSFAKHREVVEQSRELARLEELNQSLRATADAAPQPAEIEALAARVAQLETALADAQDARAEAQSRAEAAEAEAAGLRRELTLAQERMRELEAARQVVAATDASDGDANDSDAAPGALAAPPADGETRIASLNEDLAQARAQRDALARRVEEEQSAAELTIAQLNEQLEGGVAATRQLRSDLQDRTAEAERLRETSAAADAEIERLRGDLDAALADAAALRTAAANAESALAGLQAEMAGPEPAGPAADEAVAADLAELKRSAEAAVEEAAGLKATLASAEARIASLSADLASARRELAAVRQVPASAPALDGDAPQDAGVEARELQGRLAAANQRIDELEGALRRSLLNLAPLPSPPAPR